MRITCPGRYGDVLWAMAVARAISEGIGEPLDLKIAGEFESLGALLCQQPYIKTVVADPAWALTPEMAWCAPYSTVEDVALGYRGWPDQPLPQYVYQQTKDCYHTLPMAPLDLTRPWITVQDPLSYGQAPKIACGWSDCHFELKYGLMELLDTDRGFSLLGLPPAGSRWTTEGGYVAWAWQDAARAIAACTVFLGDCSALHVLAVALGKPVILMEPMEARWNDIFYPLGKSGSAVHLVVGLDGRPTFDARHVADALKEALAHAR